MGAERARLLSKEQRCPFVLTQIQSDFLRKTPPTKRQNPSRYLRGSIPLKMAIGDRPPSVYAIDPLCIRAHALPVLRTHTPGYTPRTPASGPRSVFRLFRGCNKCKCEGSSEGREVISRSNRHCKGTGDHRSHTTPRTLSCRAELVPYAEPEAPRAARPRPRLAAPAPSGRQPEAFQRRCTARAGCKSGTWNVPSSPSSTRQTSLKISTGVCRIHYRVKGRRLIGRSPRAKLLSGSEFVDQCRRYLSHLPLATPTPVGQRACRKEEGPSGRAPPRRPRIALSGPLLARLRNQSARPGRV